MAWRRVTSWLFKKLVGWLNWTTLPLDPWKSWDRLDLPLKIQPNTILSHREEKSCMHVGSRCEDWKDNSSVRLGQWLMFSRSLCFVAFIFVCFLSFYSQVKMPKKVSFTKLHDTLANPEWLDSDTPTKLRLLHALYLVWFAVSLPRRISSLFILSSGICFVCLAFSCSSSFPLVFDSLAIIPFLFVSFYLPFVSGPMTTALLSDVCVFVCARLCKNIVLLIMVRIPLLLLLRMLPKSWPMRNFWLLLLLPLLLLLQVPLYLLLLLQLLPSSPFRSEIFVSLPCIHPSNQPLKRRKNRCC